MFNHNVFNHNFEWLSYYERNFTRFSTTALKATNVNLKAHYAQAMYIELKKYCS
jgi:hypothetical protein